MTGRDPLLTGLPDDESAARVRRAKDILTTMANTVSAMKIFPAEHDTVKNFVASLEAKLQDYFELSPRLEVAVAEYSFLYEDRVVYTDETPSKSLPFFFFKDGAEILYFFQGLERRELLEFLDLVKTVSQKPAEENDIVAALWESDFSNIQYYAPDEFLENQILGEKRDVEAQESLPGLPSDLSRESLEVRVDRTAHATGRIALRPEDRERLARGLGEPRQDGALEGPGDSGPAAAPEPSAGTGPEGSPNAPGLSEAEAEEIEAMFRSNRLLWPEEEFVNLTIEIVYLEEDPGLCAASLDILRDFFLDQLRAGQFPVATLVIDKLRDLRSLVLKEAPPKAGLVDKALDKLAGPRTLGALDTALNSNLTVGWPAVLTFFRTLGPPALTAAAGLYERLSNAEVRTDVLEFIRDCGRADPASVVRMASDVRPALSLEIIRLLAELPEDKGLPPMSAFLDFKSRDIKLEAIQALGRRKSERANRLLIGFLEDPDEVIRIQAALHLDQVGEKAQILHIIEVASSPAFRKKGLKEKQAVLGFLGRTRAPEAFSFLTAIVKRAPLWSSTRGLEMRLAAITGLERMATPEAREALEAGCRRRRGKRIREACAEALDRMSAAASGRA